MVSVVAGTHGLGPVIYVLGGPGTFCLVLWGVHCCIGCMTSNWVYTVSSSAGCHFSPFGGPYETGPVKGVAFVSMVLEKREAGNGNGPERGELCSLWS